MDPHRGTVYDSLDDALAAGVKNPVEMVGRPEDVARISKAVKAKWRDENRKKKAKAAKLARRKNR